MGLVKKIREAFSKSANDRAEGAIITSFIVAFPFIAIILSLVVDLTMSINSKIEYNEVAQNAARAALVKIDARGSMGNDSVREFAKVWHENLDESTVITSSKCNTAEINGVPRELPYFEVRLEQERKERSASTDADASTVTWKFSGETIPETKPLPGSAKYRVISADVYTASRNVASMLGTDYCSSHRSSVSSIAFGSNRDLSN